MFLGAYIGMSIWNTIAFSTSIMVSGVLEFEYIILQLILSCALDLCTVGVTLYLNLKASYQHKHYVKQREELRRNKNNVAYHSSDLSSQHSTNRILSHSSKHTSGETSNNKSDSQLGAESLGNGSGAKLSSNSQTAGQQNRVQQIRRKHHTST